MLAGLNFCMPYLARDELYPGSYAQVILAGTGTIILHNNFPPNLVRYGDDSEKSITPEIVGTGDRPTQVKIERLTPLHSN